jgi:hypothetical protein
MISHSEERFGLDSRDLRGEATDPGLEGALAALETFYHALNNRGAEILVDWIAW